MSDDPQRASLITLYLRQLRALRNLSQADVARAIGLSLRTVERWEEGINDEMKGTRLIAISQVVGADLHHLAYILDANNGDDVVNPTYVIGLAHAQANVIPQQITDAAAYLDRQLGSTRPQLQTWVAEWLRELRPRQRKSRRPE
jgi:transcriptional regulator with XRE-family HTH domain